METNGLRIQNQAEKDGERYLEKAFSRRDDNECSQLLVNWEPTNAFMSETFEPELETQTVSDVPTDLRMSVHQRKGSLATEEVSHQRIGSGGGMQDEGMSAAQDDQDALMRSWFSTDSSGNVWQNESRLCLLFSPPPTSLIGSIVDNNFDSVVTVEFRKLELPTGFEAFMQSYTCWETYIPFQLMDLRIIVTATFPKSGILSMLKTTLFGNSEVEKDFILHLQRRRLQISILDGISNISDKDNNLRHVAFNTVLVLLNHPGVMRDCLAQFIQIKMRSPLSSKAGIEMLRKSSLWFDWIQEKLQVGLAVEACNTEWSFKMMLAFMMQMNVMRHLHLDTSPGDFMWQIMQTLRQNQQKDVELQELVKQQYAALLLLLSRIYTIAGPSVFKIHPFVSTDFLKAARELVAFTSAVEWSSYLEALCSADPSCSFIDSWGRNHNKKCRVVHPLQEKHQDHALNAEFDKADKTQTEQEYKIAVSRVLKFANDHPDINLKDKAVRAVILAAPTASMLLDSVSTLAADNLVSGTATADEVENVLSTEYGNTLIELFEWLTELETLPGVVTLLDQAFSRTSSGSMQAVLRVFTSKFVRNELLTTAPRDSKENSQMYLRSLLKHKKVLVVPLLHTENMMVNALVDRGPLELAASVLLKLSDQIDTLPEDHHHKKTIMCSLKLWLHQVCKRSCRKLENLNAHSSVAVTPYALYSSVAELLGEGLRPGFLVSVLSEIIPVLLRESCTVKTIIQDASKMSTFVSDLISSQYHIFVKDIFLEHLKFDDEIDTADAKAEQLLQWLCLQTSTLILADNELTHGDLIMGGWIQQELCMTLLNRLAGIQGYYSSLSSENLVDSSFFLTLLQLQNVQGHVKEHHLYRLASRAWSDLHEQLEGGNLKIEVIDKLLRRPHISWKNIYKEQNLEGGAFDAAAKAVTEYLNTQLKGYKMLLKYARHFEGRRCSGEVLQKWQSWMQDRSQECKHFTLNKIKEPSHWPLELSIKYLDALLVIEDSIIFENIFKEKEIHTPIYQSGNATILAVPSSSNIKDDFWTNLNNFIKSSVEEYKEMWKRLVMQDCPVDKLSFLLQGVDQEVLKSEVSLAETYFKFIQAEVNPDFKLIVSILSSWLNFLEKKTLKDPLIVVMSNMKLVEDDDHILKTLLNFEVMDIPNTLGEFLEMYKENVKVIEFFSMKETKLVKQLAESDELFSFLKKNTHEDLRMLTDAIEEQAEDAIIDEVIVSDLIHIEKLFRPLLQSSIFTIVDLKKTLAQESDETPDIMDLAGKLKYCNANIHRIRHFVASLSDRSSVLKNHMFKILESGVYTFTLQDDLDGKVGAFCKFLVVCDGARNSSLRQQFTLTDLKDLRSRARMMLNMRRIKHDMLADQAQSSNVTVGQKPNMSEVLMEFVEQVNLVEKLLEQLSDVQKSGHLLFHEVKWSISGLEFLHKRVNWMNGQIACWCKALRRAREAFNCLNFFKGIELRLMYQYFTGIASTRHSQICWEFLEWAKPGLDRTVMVRCKELFNFIKLDMDFDQTNWELHELHLNESLNCLGTAIRFIFGNVHSHHPSAPSGFQLPEAANIAPDERIHLVAVQDQQDELSVVVHIFHKHYGHLDKMSTNLLLCSSTTTWEEIDLIMFRFLTSEKEPDAFVIAYVENLTFDCQSQLTERLQHSSVATVEQLTMHQLSLVCCAKSQALHGVAHHLKVPIKYWDGMEMTSITKKLPLTCQKMRVVTSDLSGMGKSRFVKRQFNGSCVTLAISGDMSHEHLILKLKEMNIARNCMLHIDITTEKGYEWLNEILFELLICGTLRSSHAGVYRLVASEVYVELANTLGNLLEASLFICSWLPQQHLKWDINAWEVSKSIHSDDQIVCIYLDKLANERLDQQDIVFKGEKRNAAALSEAQCRELIEIFFVKDSIQMSYTILKGFIATFAYQLKKFGANDFCKCETLCWILRTDSATGNFRSMIVSSLLQISRDLSLRSVKPWLHEEQKKISMADINKSMHERMKSMIQWSESNHVMIFFDANGLIRILYRDQKLIPEGIRNILSIQARVLKIKLPDYSTLSSAELWEILWPILCEENAGFLPNYVLTPDNFLKMALVSLRIKTRVPVIIMGETGCGKTSLLRALATFSGAHFLCLTLHAGSTEQDIDAFISNAESLVMLEKRQVWVFLDEINACPHLGFLNSILCHHTNSGRTLNPDLVVVAACNPYRLQDNKLETSGLQMQKVDKKNKQELAYTVYPLPEAMLDHVWDYGILSDHDERAYISAMVGEKKGDIVELISNSQKFMREHLGFASVSLRDVQRWISLFNWFQNDIRTRLQIKNFRGSKIVERRAKVLACALCYHCRFPGKDIRRQYREMCCSFLSSSGSNTLSQAKFLKILHEEERDILSRMEIPPGIAVNSSLLENVFVVLVCLLNYIPVFVVGKPGSGKTLALHIIYSNLRGSDSKDEYLRKLPRILFLSYQGSQNSTSEGILKVFDKANRYVDSNKERDILVVVVLDEVGLAESSKHNPLKVLHPLLEPDVKKVAVVGISNWSLDAAKMNRGIHLSQSDPGIDDLYQTSAAIFESYQSSSSLFLSDTLRRLATAYHKYQVQQTRADFHGLRDFYSLMKSLRLSSIMLTPDQLAHALWRNFGGGTIEDIKSLFSSMDGFVEDVDYLSHPPPVMNLIKENLHDPEARHLMLITKGDSASNILEHMLQEDENFVVIRGSTYQDDKTEEYCYLMLSDIILYMEMGRHILLENADQIWTSLYDMLNQHYTYVGGRRNCRIALGAYSNPMCFVHENFRCIVVVEETQIPSMDPPFLNRFEKQRLTYEGILNGIQRKAVENIRDWAHHLASLGCGTSNVELLGQMFAGYYEDSIPSLVVLHSSNFHEQSNTEETKELYLALLESCKADLLQTAYIDAVARAHLSLQKSGSGTEGMELIHWTETFLSWKFLHSLKNSVEIATSMGWGDNIGMKLIITTCTPVQWSMQQDVEAPQKFTFMRLGDFTSEKQLQSHIQRFWCNNSSPILVLQAHDILDRDHISLAKFHVDKIRKVHPECTIAKHVIIIIHVQQGAPRLTNFSFLCGWKQLTLHRLQKEAIAVRYYLEQNMREILDHEAMPIKNILARVLKWSYLCIKYEDPNITALYPQELVQCITEDEELMVCIKQRAMAWVLSKVESLWQFSVLSNQKLLSTSASVHDAFVQYIEERFREAVARIVYLLEKISSPKSYFKYDGEKKYAWMQVFMHPDSLQCDIVPAPCFPEGYVLSKPMDLNLPFSSLYSAHVDEFRVIFLEKLSRNHAKYYQEGGGLQKDVDASLTPMLSIIWNCIQWDLDKYVEDFAKIHVAGLIDNHHILRTHGVDVEAIERKPIDFKALEWILRENLVSTIQHPCDLHILYWVKEHELKAQVSLALSCMSIQEIEIELASLKAGRVPKENFSEEFSKRCCTVLLPTMPYINEVRGIQSWLHKAQAVTVLLPIKGSVSLFMLQSLQDLATFVILPSKRTSSVILHKLANWFQQNIDHIGLVSILRKIVEYIPQLGTLDTHECKCWVDFLCAVLKRYPEVSDLPRKDLLLIFKRLMSSPVPSCMMGPAMLQVLSCYLSKSSFPNQRKCPILALLLLNNDDSLLQTKWSSKAAASILLSDHISHFLQQTITQALLGGEDTELWDFVVFDECLCLAAKFCQDNGAFTLRKITALAFWKSFLLAAACVLNQVKEGKKSDINTYKLVFSDEFRKNLSQMPSELKYTTNTFFLKVLYRDLGLSIGDIRGLLNSYEKHIEKSDFLFFLEHPLIRNCTNRLGFNPFVDSSEAFTYAELLFKQLLPKNRKLWEGGLHNISNVESQEEVRKFIAKANQEEQIAFVMAMASELLMLKSDAKLSEEEWGLLKWLKEIILGNKHWDSLLRHALRHLLTKEKGGIWHDKEAKRGNDLETQCLILNILFKVAALPDGSPLRGYCMLTDSHFKGAHVLTDADSFLDKVEGLGNFREYVCSCGFHYIIGNCTQPAQVAKCPNCSGNIGGTNHTLLQGQHVLKESGRTVSGSVLNNIGFSLRIRHRSYRLLRILVYSCFLIGTLCNGDITDLCAFMRIQNDKWTLVKALKQSIDNDLVLLGKLLNCQRETTVKFIYSIMHLLSHVTFEGPLKTIAQRDSWEEAFEKVMEDQPVQELISKYMNNRGTDGLMSLLLERTPCPPESLQTYFRITKIPSFYDYEAMFLQSDNKSIEYPCTAAFLAHQEELRSLKNLMPIVRFSACLHQNFGYKITRLMASTTSIVSFLQERSDLLELYDQFEESWNSIRFEVEGFECRQFKVPVMHKDQPVSLCLLEKKDQGIFITSIFEHIRTRQNDFLREVESTILAQGAVQHRKDAIVHNSILTVPIQKCKDDQVVRFEESWLNELVRDLGMCRQTYSEGTSILYDDLQINSEIFRKLFQGKPLLQGVKFSKIMLNSRINRSHSRDMQP
ncbi:hypothetical protein KP509_01G064300 [Ceratopteris richardii]|uniref:RZ-type domain-containing protein n=1 Tax=Ceratopteris richardii TaxID=49495 RepID=A0A8T2VM01_CERRI|nr:hypothetical protein KP509_01G064300 [Ceratopteris richardii]